MDHAKDVVHTSHTTLACKEIARHASNVVRWSDDSEPHAILCACIGWYQCGHVMSNAEVV